MSGNRKVQHNLPVGQSPIESRFQRLKSLANKLVTARTAVGGYPFALIRNRPISNEKLLPKCNTAIRFRPAITGGITLDRSRSHLRLLGGPSDWNRTAVTALPLYWLRYR